MPDLPFVYLHVRTPYGPGGGPGLPAAYAGRARELGYPALACADRGSVGAWPGWAAACAAAGIAPIFGLELAVRAAGGAAPVPLLLLARDAAGLRHLITLYNAAQGGMVAPADLAAHAGCV